MSDNSCLMADVRCLMFKVRCPTSDVWCPMSDVWNPMSDVWCLIFDYHVWCPKSLLSQTTHLFQCFLCFKGMTKEYSLTSPYRHLYNTDASVRRTLGSFPLVSVFKTFDSTILVNNIAMRMLSLTKFIRHRTSPIRHRTTNMRHQTLDIRHQTSDIRHQKSGKWHHTSYIRRLILDSWH